MYWRYYVPGNPSPEFQSSNFITFICEKIKFKKWKDLYKTILGTIKIAKVTSAGFCERSWSTFEFIYTTKHNGTTCPTVKDNAREHCNLFFLYRIKQIITKAITPTACQCLIGILTDQQLSDFPELEII